MRDIPCTSECPNAALIHSVINSSGVIPASTPNAAHASNNSPANFVYRLIGRGKSPWEDDASISNDAILYGTASSLSGRGVIESYETTNS